MTIINHVIVIPVFNDWRSLSKLLIKINFLFKKTNKISTEILILDDNSSEKISIDFKKLKSLKRIQVLRLKKNLGSQKTIAIGLDYLKKSKNDFFVTVMDGDGEDSPYQIKKMLNVASRNKNFVVTANRKKRKESLIIIILYKIHLLITFLFTFKWISFGNFSTFHKENLNKILSGNSSWYAHSSSIIKNCNIKRLYSKRERRYYDKSKLGLFALIEHSLRVNAVFINNIFFSSISYLLIIILLIPNNSQIFLVFGIISFNLVVIFIKIKHWIKNLNKISKFKKSIQLIKTF